MLIGTINLNRSYMAKSGFIYPIAGSQPQALLIVDAPCANITLHSLSQGDSHSPCCCSNATGYLAPLQKLLLRIFDT